MTTARTYTVPRMWEGRTVAVMASGPSMSQEVADRVRAAGLPAIVVNDTYRLAPWADILYAADRRWWEANPEAVTEFAGTKLVAQSGLAFSDVILIQRSGNRGFDARPQFIRTGGNSGYAAVHIALHTGAARVLLLGFDMHGKHWFGSHSRRAPNNRLLTDPSPHSFALWCERFNDLRGAAGADIVNCTPGSALKAFRFSRLEDELEAVEHAS